MASVVRSFWPSLTVSSWNQPAVRPAADDSCVSHPYISNNQNICRIRSTFLWRTAHASTGRPSAVCCWRILSIYQYSHALPFPSKHPLCRSRIHRRIAIVRLIERRIPPVIYHWNPVHWLRYAINRQPIQRIGSARLRSSAFSVSRIQTDSTLWFTTPSHDPGREQLRSLSFFSSLCVLF